MGQILNSSEVEALLSSLNSSDSAAGPASSSVNDVSLYDFDHPQPLRPAQMDALRLSSAATSRKLQAGLTRLLRTRVVVNFMAVEQSTVHDYLATCENPTCLATFRSIESTGIWLIDMNRLLAFTIVDCLLGGQPSVPAVVLTRTFTDVETRMITKGLASILKDLSGELLQTESLEFLQLVCDPALAENLASNEAVALISFEIVCGPCQGLLQLCVPWKDISNTSTLVQAANGKLGDQMRFAAGKVPVVLKARLPRLRLSARDVAQLAPGDLLVTDTDSKGELSLEVDNREIFRGTPAQSHNRKVILVTSAISARSDDATMDVT